MTSAGIFHSIGPMPLVDVVIIPSETFVTAISTKPLAEKIPLWESVALRKAFRHSHFTYLANRSHSNADHHHRATTCPLFPLRRWRTDRQASRARSNLFTLTNVSGREILPKILPRRLSGFRLAKNRVEQKSAHYGFLTDANSTPSTAHVAGRADLPGLVWSLSRFGR